MNPFLEIYNLIFYQPVSGALFFFYKHLKDFGLAVISLTTLIRIALFPLDYESSKEEKKFLRIKKAIEEIEKKFDGEKKSQEIVNLYKREKINPFFSLFSLGIQLPILVSLYRVLLGATTKVNPFFFGIFNLSEPNLLLTSIAIFIQVFYLRFSPQKTNLFFVPLSFFILLKLPSAISLYFMISYLFLIFEKIIFHGRIS